jgi:predicted RNase H-like nuclease
LSTLILRSEFVELEALFWLIARSLLFDVPSRIFPKTKLTQSRINIAKLGLKLSEDWSSRLKNCKVSRLNIKLQSEFRQQVHCVLKQLKALTSQLDILDSIISVVVALHALRPREEQNLVEVEPPEPLIVRPPQVGRYHRARPSLNAATRPPQSIRAQHRILESLSSQYVGNMQKRANALIVVRNGMSPKRPLQ